MEYSLKDIAGYELEKEKLKEIIYMFKNYQNYKEKGVLLSKGLILSGDPGVGKTLFAKVLANEINAPFYYIDGRKMDNFFGVYKVNKLFKKAYKHAPAVIFIDELNSFIGDYDYESDYTNRNLSTLLKLIDGIDKKEGVFIIGATSDKDSLDKAILRSGRMDKHICLNSPDLKSRIAIFNYYLSKVDVETDKIDINYLMNLAEGFTGADIKTLINESALEALYNGDLLENDILISNIRKIKNQDLDRLANRNDLAYYAYHDIAHMIVSRSLLGKYEPISIKYEDSLLGNTSIKFSYNDSEDDYYDEDDNIKDLVHSLSKEDILNYVTVLLAGRALEEVKYHTHYLKCNNDVSTAARIIYNAFDGGVFGFEYAHIRYYADDFDVSHFNMKQNEDKKTEILNRQYNIALDIIKDNIDYIEILYNKLIKSKALSISEIEAILE